MAAIGDAHDRDPAGVADMPPEERAAGLDDIGLRPPVGEIAAGDEAIGAAIAGRAAEIRLPDGIAARSEQLRYRAETGLDVRPWAAMDLDDERSPLRVGAGRQGQEAANDNPVRGAEGEGPPVRRASRAGFGWPNRS